MELLERLSVPYRDRVPTIGVYHGDLARIPPEEAVDLLVVSAFPGDYSPLPGTLIHALYQTGVSVGQLARDKADDFRDELGCWLSRELPREVAPGFRRILCFEPTLRGDPPELVGDIFRCLMPIVQGELPMRAIALPLVASGNQRIPAERMFPPLVEAATRWLELGLPIDAIKIVECARDKAERLADALRRLAGERVRGPLRRSQGFPHDVFLSYAREDQRHADYLDSLLRAHPSRPTVFKDTLEIDAGASWQQAIWEALEASRRVVALYSPPYLESKVCQEEYAIARLRHREESDVLVPLYLRSARLPAYMRILNYQDCREADRDRLAGALPSILAS